jgi:hypothetical protein
MLGPRLSDLGQDLSLHAVRVTSAFTLRAAQEQTFGFVRFGSKADVTLLNYDVRFTPESGHS